MNADPVFVHVGRQPNAAVGVPADMVPLHAAHMGCSDFLVSVTSVIDNAAINLNPDYFYLPGCGRCISTSVAKNVEQVSTFP